MLDKLVEALAANVSARKAFIEAHGLTPELIMELGLERMFGDISPCPRTERANGSAHVVPRLSSTVRSATRSPTGP